MSKDKSMSYIFPSKIVEIKILEITARNNTPFFFPLY